MITFLEAIEGLLSKTKKLGVYFAWMASLLPTLTYWALKLTYIVADWFTRWASIFVERTDGMLVFAVFAGVGGVVISRLRMKDEGDALERATRWILTGGAVFCASMVLIGVVIPAIAEFAASLADAIADFYNEKGRPALRQLLWFVFGTYLILFLIDVAVACLLLKQSVRQKLIAAAGKHFKDLWRFSLDFFEEIWSLLIWIFSRSPGE